MQRRVNDEETGHLISAQGRKTKDETRGKGQCIDGLEQISLEIIARIVEDSN
jgi:hypothetical protein